MSAGRSGAVVRVKTIPGAMVRAAVLFEVDPPFVDGEPVIIHADGTLVMGHVVSTPAAVLDRHGPIGSLPHVLRRADAQDLYLRQRHEQREVDAFRIGVMKIRERGLAMKLARVEQAFDGSKLLFFFTAEERVDFRELVRELAGD
ncbi:MAG: PSP1 domain-containing protein, partial [Acidobacteriota bacterium]